MKTVRLTTLECRGDANLQDQFVQDQKARLADLGSEFCKIGKRSLQQGELGRTVIVQGSF